MESGSTTLSISQEYDPIIVLPGRAFKNRIPGLYPDLPTKEKAKNNISILHACKLLKCYYNSEPSINALVLDGKKMRTTNTLTRLGKKLNNITIVEYNNETYEKMLNSKKLNPKIQIYNCHIKEYIDSLNNSYTNVAYFDIMSTFFTSDKSYGSDIIINKFLKESLCNEIILAATFCLRNSLSQSHQIQQKRIMILLQKIFEVNGFKYKSLISDKNLRYKGQNTGNRSMMFVLFFLYREPINKCIDLNIPKMKEDKFISLDD
jgi:hypothetical protein